MIEIITVEKFPGAACFKEFKLPVTYLLHRVKKNPVDLSDDAPDLHLFAPNGCLTEDRKQFAVFAKTKEQAVEIALLEIGKRYEIKEEK